MVAKCCETDFAHSINVVFPQLAGALFPLYPAWLDEQFTSRFWTRSLDCVVGHWVVLRSPEACRSSAAAACGWAPPALCTSPTTRAPSAFGSGARSSGLGKRGSWFLEWSKGRPKRSQSCWSSCHLGTHPKVSSAEGFVTQPRGHSLHTLSIAYPVYQDQLARYIPCFFSSGTCLTLERTAWLVACPSLHAPCCMPRCRPRLSDFP